MEHSSNELVIDKGKIPHPIVMWCSGAAVCLICLQNPEILPPKISMNLLN